MDIDALAREVAGRFVRGELSGPPLPPHYAQWMERLRAEAERAHAEFPEASDASAMEWPPFESFEQAGYERIGDLDVYLYRVEPTASALLLVLRDDTLAYASFAGMRFMGPMHSDAHFPPYDLAMMAVRARATGELDLSHSGLNTQGDGPISVAFEIESGRYAALDDSAREALHGACAPIAGDAALLCCGRPGPLHIVFVAPEEPQTGSVHYTGLPRTTTAEFDVPA